MKKNKKGFTLVELLAVIVVLGIIMVIAGSNLLQTKKTANIEEAKKMEKMIEDLGPGIYADEKLRNSDGDFMDYYKKNTSFYITKEILKNAGYLKSDIKNPNGNETCEAYLLIEPANGFKGYINCPDLYATSSFDNSKINCSSGSKCLKWQNSKLVKP